MDGVSFYRIPWAGMGLTDHLVSSSLQGKGRDIFHYNKLLKVQLHILVVHFVFFFLTDLLLIASLLEKLKTMRAATGSEQASSGDKKATCKTVPLLSIPSLPETFLDRKGSRTTTHAAKFSK